MIENGKFANAVKEKWGIPVYRTNPSIPGEHEIKKMRRTKLGDDHRGLVVDNGTGEILGHGGAIAYEWEEVDKERFGKLYLAGLKQAAGLSKAGLAVFEIVYNEMGGKPGKDCVLLGVSMSNLEERTFNRGLRELLEKEFLYRSTLASMFFVNIRFMFNGDRLAFVKGYRLKKEDPRQPRLPLEDPPALPAPNKATGDHRGS
jgi:hypothetical protein